eukprot:11100686-Karenia_brevis.AAC.1
MERPSVTDAMVELGPFMVESSPRRTQRVAMARCSSVTSASVRIISGGSALRLVPTRTALRK